MKNGSPPKSPVRVADLSSELRQVMLALVRIGVQEQANLRPLARAIGQELTEESLIELLDLGWVKCVWDGEERYAFVPWNPRSKKYERPGW